MRDNPAAHYEAGERPLVVGRCSYLPFEVALGLYGAPDTLAAVMALWNARGDVRAAVLASSPALYSAAKAWVAGKPQKNGRVPLKLLMYFVRMSTRATPFGLFAGIGAIDTAETFDLQLEAKPFRTATRPDMGWLAEVLERVIASPERRDGVPVYANPLACVRGSRLHVYHPTNLLAQGDRFDYARSSVRNTSGVEFVRAEAAVPLTFAALRERIVHAFETSPERANALLENLLEAGVLLADLKPAPVDAPLDRAVDQLRELDLESAAQLIAVRQRCSDVDAIALDDRRDDHYGVLADTLRDVLPYERSPFQVDTYVNFGGSISRRVLDDAQKLGEYLMRCGGRVDLLAGFRRRFVERYEGVDRLVPLLDITDPDVGLGMPEPDERERNGAPDDRWLMDVAIDAIRERTREVLLDESFLAKHLPPLELPSLPPTIEVGFEIHAASREAIERGDYLLAAAAYLGSDRAGRSIGRFGHLVPPRVNDGVRNLSGGNAEDVIDAELFYPPFESRLLDMATRPRYVAYDLPIGVRPDGNESRSIDPRDVYVGVDRGRFFLWSRSLSREIVVHESHALSPLHCAPGLVCFLSMLARQNVHNNSGVNWGAARQFPFLPRIRVGRLVLSPAQWLLDVETLRAAKDRAEWIRDWRERWNVPEFVFAKENDNRLLLRLSHPTCADLILASVNDASKRFVRLTEAMSTEMPHWFDAPDGSRDVEFVASFRTVSPQKARARAKASIVDPVIRTRPPHSEWTSIKVPSGTGDHDRLIARFGALASELRRVGYTERWFFLRYSDPRDHIRIRFRCSDGMKAEQDHEVFAFLERLTHDRELSEYSIETYQREVERYGGEVAIDFAEEIFMIDSEAVAHDLLGPGFDAERLGRAVLSCDPLVAAFGTPAVMAEWAEAIPRHESRGSASFHSTVKRLRAELLSRRARLAANPFEMPVGALRSLVGAAPSERSAFRILDSLVHMHFNRNGVVRDEPEALQLQRELYKGLAHTTTDRMVLR